MKKCKTCEEIEFWETEKPNQKEFKSKLFAKISRYTWHKSQIARKGDQISDITSKAYDLNYCPTCGTKISDIKVSK